MVRLGGASRPAVISMNGPRAASAQVLVVVADAGPPDSLVADLEAAGIPAESVAAGQTVAAATVAPRAIIFEPSVSPLDVLRTLDRLLPGDGNLHVPRIHILGPEERWEPRPTDEAEIYLRSDDTHGLPIAGLIRQVAPAADGDVPVAAPTPTGGAASRRVPRSWPPLESAGVLASAAALLAVAALIALLGTLADPTRDAGPDADTHAAAGAGTPVPTAAGTLVPTVGAGTLVPTVAGGAPRATPATAAPAPAAAGSLTATVGASTAGAGAPTSASPDRAGATPSVAATAVAAGTATTRPSTATPPGGATPQATRAGPTGAATSAATGQPGAIAVTPTPRPTTAPTGPTPPAGPTPSPLPAPAVTPTPDTYVVQAGDTLVAIADRLGVGLFEILALNWLPNPDLIRVGQRILVPAPSRPAQGAVKR